MRENAYVLPASAQHIVFTSKVNDQYFCTFLSVNVIVVHYCLVLPERVLCMQVSSKEMSNYLRMRKGRCLVVLARHSGRRS